MSQLIAILVFLSTILVHATGMFIDTPRKHLHRHRDFRSYKLKESVHSDLTLLGLHKKRNQDWLKWEEKIRENSKDAMEEYKRTKREDKFSIHTLNMQNYSNCTFDIIKDNVIDTNNTMFSMDLQHIKCRHIDSRCITQNEKCCMQMFTTINITYSNNHKEKKMIYTGCVYTHPWIENSTRNLPNSNESSPRQD